MSETAQPQWEPTADLPPVFPQIKPQTPPPGGDGKEPCPVPGCPDRITKNALGPHLKMHRNRGDAGVPPPKYPSKSKAARSARTASTPGRKPTRSHSQRLVDDEQIADGVLALLYPVAIPLHRLREVAAWVQATDRLAAHALADAAQPEEPPS